MKSTIHELQKSGSKVVSEILKTTIAIFAMAILTSCSKDDNAVQPTPVSVLVREYSLTVESINATGTTKKCFINLYNGLLYNDAEALENANQVDFAYNYGNQGRFFENPSSMRGRTSYIPNWSTYNNSKIRALLTTVTASDFENIKTNDDIDSLIAAKSITFGTGGGEYSTAFISAAGDVATSVIFAFTDKTGKKGFIKIGNYTANAPGTSTAPLPMQIKISK